MKFTEVNSEMDDLFKALHSYLTDSGKVSDVKKCVKSSDFGKLSYPDKVKLSVMFDPSREISNEVFKREIELYFSLLENKGSPIKIPVFSDYIEWVYSQDPSKMPDDVFKILSSRLVKSTADHEILPDSVGSFMTKVVDEYSQDLDKISNDRLEILVYVLNNLGSEYDQMPEECKQFIKCLFMACAVKTEISDKNQQKFRGLFKYDPQKHYSSFNKAFARRDYYDSWIDEPAKKLNYQNMINYANFQEKVLEYSMYKMDFDLFGRCAIALSLPRLASYDVSSSYFDKDYLRAPREYKAYAKKMAKLFSQMVRSEARSIVEQGISSEGQNDKQMQLFSYMMQFAPTHKMQKGMKRIIDVKNPIDRGLKFGDELIDLIHLDDLLGQAKRNIFDSREIINSCEGAQEFLKKGRNTYFNEYEIDQTGGLFVGDSLMVRSFTTEDNLRRLKREKAEIEERFKGLSPKDRGYWDLVQKLYKIDDEIESLSEPESEPGEKNE